MARSRKKLLQSGPASFSSFIDVVLSGLGAMIVIVIVLILYLGREDRCEPVQFLREFSAPPVVPGEQYLFTLPVTGGCGERRFSISKGDPTKLGFVFDTRTGTIAGVPMANPGLKEYTIDFQVTDRDGRQDECSLVFEVWEAKLPIKEFKNIELVHQEERLPSARVGLPYEAVIGVSSVTPDYKATIDGLPPGVGPTSKTVGVTGTPTDAGTFGLTVGVEQQPGSYKRPDGATVSWNASHDSRRFTLTVEALPLHRLVLPPARSGKSYTAALLTSSRFPYETITIDGLPPELSFDQKTGLIEGIPNSPAVYSLEYKIMNGDTAIGKGRGNLNVTEPLSHQLLLGTARVGRSFSGALVTGPRAPDELLTLSGLPETLSLDPQTGLISGVPEQAGRYSLEYTIMQENKRVGEGDKLLIVHPALEHQFVLPNARVQESFSGAVITNARLRGETISISGLPTGLVFNELSGFIEGIPESPGMVQLMYQIKDGNETVGEGEGELHVLPRRPIPKAGSLVLQAFQNTASEAMLPTRGLVEPVSFSSESALPPGLTLTDEGVLRGTPNSLGVFSVAVNATDSSNKSANATLEIHVSGPPSFTSQSLPRGFVGTSYEVSPAVRGGIGILTITTESDLPPGLAMNAGSLTGVPTETGTWSVIFDAVDEKDNATASNEMSLVITREDSSTPRITTGATLPDAIVGRRYELTFAASGGVGDVSFQHEGELPEGLKITASRIEGVPKKVGSTTFRLCAVDQTNQESVREEITISVIPRAANE